MQFQQISIERCMYSIGRRDARRQHIAALTEMRLKARILWRYDLQRAKMQNWQDLANDCPLLADMSQVNKVVYFSVIYIAKWIPTICLHCFAGPAWLPRSTEKLPRQPWRGWYVGKAKYCLSSCPFPKSSGEGIRYAGSKSIYGRVICMESTMG